MDSFMSVWRVFVICSKCQYLQLWHRCRHMLSSDCIKDQSTRVLKTCHVAPFSQSLGFICVLSLDWSPVEVKTVVEFVQRIEAPFLFTLTPSGWMSSVGPFMVTCSETVFVFLALSCYFPCSLSHTDAALSLFVWHKRRLGLGPGQPW